MWVLCSEADYLLYYMQVTGYLQFIVYYFGYMLRVGYGELQVADMLRMGHSYIVLEVVFMLLAETQHRFSYILPVDLMFDAV